MNIALIGLGMVAGTHVTAIRESDQGLRLHGVWARDPIRTTQFANDNKTRAYGSLQAIADDDDVDFVILATPPDARLNIVETLVSAGKPILMEKPIERNLQEATRIVALCEAARVPLGIVLQHRARAASIALKQAIEAGQLGQITTVEIRVPWWRDQAYYDVAGRGTYARDGGGVMMSQAIHTLDLAMWLAGPIGSVLAMLRTSPLHKLEAEDWAGALLEFQSGAVGTMMATTAAFPGAAESITLQGTKAAAHLESGVCTLTRLDATQEIFGAVANTGAGADPMAFTHAWHQSVIEDFATSLILHRAPMADGRSALQSHAVIDAMQTASDTDRRTKVTI